MVKQIMSFDVRGKAHNVKGHYKDDGFSKYGSFVYQINCIVSTGLEESVYSITIKKYPFYASQLRYWRSQPDPFFARALRRRKKELTRLNKIFQKKREALAEKFSKDNIFLQA